MIADDVALAPPDAYAIIGRIVQIQPIRWMRGPLAMRPVTIGERRPVLWSLAT
jgi:hypothetical protein